MLALATCAGARDVDADLPLLQAQMPEARIVVWDDPTVEWAAFRAVVIRSTWDYHERRDEFMQWARRVEAESALWNPLDLIEWNTDKRYLADLDGAGVPVVPTHFVDAGASPTGEFEVGDGDLGEDLVIKPSIGAGSNGVVRTRGDRALARRHIHALTEGGQTALVQPYLAEIETAGETGLVFLGGRFSHAFRKSAILAAPVRYEAGLFATEEIEPCVATPAEIAIGERVVGDLPTTAYARIDLLPTEHGPVVLEVEVTEPSLYLHLEQRAAARAAAVFRSLAS